MYVYVVSFNMPYFYHIQPVEDKVPTSAQKRRPSSSAKTKQNAIISPHEPIKEEQIHRSSSSKIRHSAQVSGSQEKIANLPSEMSLNNEEQNKSETSNYNKEIKKSGVSEENNERQQSAEKKSEQMPTTEVADSQNETTTET